MKLKDTPTPRPRARNPRLRLHLGACLLLALLGPALPAKLSAETWQVDGTEYQGVKVTSVSPAAVFIRHNKGLASLPLKQLPPELQQRFGYDPTTEADYRETQAQQAEAARQQEAARTAARLKEAASRANKKTGMDAALEGLDGPVTLAPSVDLRQKFIDYGLSPNNQGRRPSCSVFAVASAFDYALARAGRKENLSEEYLIWATAKALGRKPQDWTLEGDSPEEPADLGFALRSVLLGAQLYGAALEEEVPNAVLGSFQEIETPSDELIERSRARRTVRAARLAAARNSEEQFARFIHLLNNEWPVVIGVRWPHAVTLRARPLLHAQEPRTDYNHAVTLVGYIVPDGDPAKTVFIFRNSWGPRWGLGGHGYISRDYLAKNLTDALILDITHPE